MNNNNKVRNNVKECYFCKNGKNPSYKDEEELKHFMSDGKIQSRYETGCCAKHQRELAREIKRARKILLV